MWIFTSKGFVSIVKHRTEPEGFIIRSRDKKHLADILSKLPFIEIKETRAADYRFRAIIKSEELRILFYDLQQSINYDNFKNSIRDKDFHSAALRVWQVMYDFQERKRGNNGRNGLRERSRS